MDYQLKEFTGRNVRLENRITVTKSYSIGLPTKFYKDNKLENVKYVVLFYDENKKAIGLYFTSEEARKNKFAIIRSKAGFGGSVVARSFFKTFNIDPKKYHGRYEWEIIKQEGVGDIFVINLKENTKEVPTNTAASPA